MTTEGGGPARTPLEAVILALRRSRASHLTGSAVLRQVLGSSYRDLVQGGRFDLAPIWELLAGQPGFDAAEAMPAFARVKGWESMLGTTIELPPPMQHLTEAALAEMAASVHVPASELAHILRGGKVESEPGESAAPPAAEPPVDAAPPRRRLSTTQRRAATIAAGAVALLGFAFAGITLARGCQGARRWDRVALEFAADIPLAGAGRSGPEVAATLRDPTWLEVPVDRRRDQMRAALRALPADVDVFFVRDRGGTVIASARWFGRRPRQIAVTLR